MKNWLIVVLVMIAVATAFGADNEKKSTGIFSELKVGQHVNLTEHTNSYSISYFEKEIELANRVVKIGDDFVVVRDVAGVKEIRIPVYALKGIEKVRVGE
jgi:hypothetical protein